MIGGAKPHGYTIVEVLVFLTVSAALMVSVLSVMNGQQHKAEFTQAARELESKVQDTINDVATGFYPTTGQVRCEAAAAGPITLSQVTREQGSNANCTFIGRFIQFAPSNNRRKLRVYTIAGRRLRESTRLEATNLQEVQGKAIAKTSAGDLTTPDNVFDEIDIGPVKIDRVTYDTNNGAGPNRITGGIGIFTTFNNYQGGSLSSGSTAANLVPLPNTTPPSSPPADPLTQDPYAFITRLNTKLLPANVPSLPVNPNGGVTICILSEGSKQFALLKIGGSARNLTTNLTFYSGGACTNV